MEIFLGIWLAPIIVATIINTVAVASEAEVTYSVDWDIFWMRQFCIIVWPLFIVVMLLKGMINAISTLFLN